MIIHAIQLENWRCFIEPISVGPFDEGLNVLYAPNATGKSTLFEALRRALLDGHRVSGQDVNEIRPWGRTLSPKVVVEFAHQDVDYRITKQFLDASASLLERREDGRFTRLAEHDEADAQVRKMITHNPPGRGLARPEHWGLAQILWAPQGNLALPDLSGNIIADIRASLGVQVTATGSGPIEERIEARYLDIFTPGGRFKTGREATVLVRLRERENEVRERRNDAVRQQQAYEDIARRIEDLRANRVQARRNADAINETLQEVRERTETYRRLTTEQRQSQESFKAVEAQYEALHQRIEGIRNARKEMDKAREELGRFEEDLPVQTKEVDARHREATEARAHLEDRRKARGDIDEALQTADQARRFNEHQQALQSLTTRIDALEEAEKQRDACRQERNAFVAPDSKALRAIRKAVKQRDDAQVRIEASLITLEIVPENDGTLEVIEGEEKGAVRFQKDSPARIQGSPEVVADIERFGRVRASGPAGSIDEHRKEKAKADEKLGELTEPFGTTDIDALEALNDRAKELDKKADDAASRLEMLLDDDTVEALEQERALSEATLTQVIEQFPAWQAQPPDGEGLRSEADRRRREVDGAIKEAEAQWEKTQASLTTAQGNLTRLKDQLDQAGRQIQSLETRLAEWTGDGKDDKEREAEHGRLAVSVVAARATLESIEQQMKAFGDDPSDEVENFERQLKAADEEAEKAREEQTREEGRLEHLSAEGTYSALAAAEEELEQLNREIEAEALHAEAIRLLYDTTTQCRASAVASVVGPVETAATRTLQRIAGSRLGRLQLGASFGPDAILPDLSESSVALDNVSGGEKEQIYLATRLALAEVFARDERRLVVLDDVMIFTDAGRLARVMNVLEETAQRLQILILTCHPERYRGLERAHFIDLEAIVRGG